MLTEDVSCYALILCRVMASSYVASRSHTRCTTLGRTPLGEWSARRKNLFLTKHNTHKIHPRTQRNSNPQSHQASGRRPKP